MNIQDRVEIEITDMGTEGEGIGRVDGAVVFVQGAVSGDRVLVEITQVKKNFSKGKIVEICQPSTLRAKPVCKYAGQCGGCSLAFMSYEGQLQQKRKWVTDRLSRIGGIDETAVEPVIGMTNEDRFPVYLSERMEEEMDGTAAGQALGEAELFRQLPFVGGFPARYRNKAQFPVRAGRLVKNREGKYRNERPCSVGFYKPKSHEVVHCESCLIQAEPAETVAAVVKRYVDENTVSVYDEKTGMGLLRHVMVRSAFATGEVMVVLVVNGDHLPKIELLVEMLDEAVNAIPFEETSGRFWSMESVVLNVNKAKGSEVLGKECITIAGKSSITDCMGGLKFNVSPRSFYQVNTVQMKKLYDKVVEYAQLTGEETLLDLYCGVGTIGLYCAASARRVIGIESVRPAVMDANRNAVINGIVNAEFICGKAEEILSKRLPGIKADVVILDPPRAGCDPALLEAVLKIAPQRIVFVSCDPATLARDLKVLTEGIDFRALQAQEEMGDLDETSEVAADGEMVSLSQYEPVEVHYCVEKVQPVDMFPGSGHIECCVLLTKA